MESKIIQINITLLDFNKCLQDNSLDIFTPSIELSKDNTLSSFDSVTTILNELCKFWTDLNNSMCESKYIEYINILEETISIIKKYIGDSTVPEETPGLINIDIKNIEDKLIVFNSCISPNLLEISKTLDANLTTDCVDTIIEEANVFYNDTYGICVSNYEDLVFVSSTEEKDNKYENIICFEEKNGKPTQQNIDKECNIILECSKSFFWKYNKINNCWSSECKLQSIPTRTGSTQINISEQEPSAK